jgi:hypothetical protein
MEDQVPRPYKTSYMLCGCEIPGMILLYDWVHEA